MRRGSTNTMTYKYLSWVSGVEQALLHTTYNNLALALSEVSDLARVRILILS